MSPPPRWLTALSKLFGEYKNANVMQLTTIAEAVPQARSCIVRELISLDGNEHLPIILTTTDIRTPKVEQILANDTVQINWWIEDSMDQFRLTGKASLVPEPGNRVFHSGGTLAFESLLTRGFDWEAKRVQVFDSLSGHMRASWCRPTPGSLMKGGYEEAKDWPETVPTTSGATNEKEKKLVEQALGNFALVLIEPTYVDWVQLGTSPNRRTFFHRGDDGSWTETIVVP
ncbi:hypothetical protein BJ322DRAFT_1052049 [Thelephora terrestris]|uniref:Pyridoxamine 5'-phosphate oxidase Alr4036 family FMN-binding domain-containing protein n=1 Tax=Thelephora terrestris TaxID=56493 RepID=A0A9P6HHB9_9AGAM|nr:hypothetical protein BJ322DRAFT_1052049 [Thelephora terrestris]